MCGSNRNKISLEGCGNTERRGDNSNILERYNRAIERTGAERTGSPRTTGRAFPSFFPPFFLRWVGLIGPFITVTRVFRPPLHTRPSPTATHSCLVRLQSSRPYNLAPPSPGSIPVPSPGTPRSSPPAEPWGRRIPDGRIVSRHSGPQGSAPPVLSPPHPPPHPAANRTRGFPPSDEEVSEEPPLSNPCSNSPSGPIFADPNSPRNRPPCCPTSSAHQGLL